MAVDISSAAGVVSAAVIGGGIRFTGGEGVRTTRPQNGGKKGVNEILSEADEGYASKLHDDWRATRKIEATDARAADGQPLREARWKAVKADDPAFAKTPERFKWLERNGSWAPPEQNKPYIELAEVEKAKDRVIVEGAVDHVNGQFEASSVPTRMVFLRR